MKLTLKVPYLSRAEWDKVLEFCRARDVENGETNEYMYSVRSKTGVLTIWGAEGWRNNWYHARITPKKYRYGAQGDMVRLEVELGVAPTSKAWTLDYLTEHVDSLITAAGATRDHDNTR